MAQDQDTLRSKGPLVAPTQQDASHPRKPLATILGVQSTSHPPASSHDSSEDRPTPVIDGVPDSFGAMAQKCIALGEEKRILESRNRKLAEDLETSRETNRAQAQTLAELETNCAAAERERARAEVAHRAAEDELDRERAAHVMTKAEFEMNHANDLEDLRRAIGALTQASPDETVACFRRITEYQRRQVEAFQAYLRQEPPGVDEEFQAAFHVAIGAMASLGVAYKKATGRDPLEAQQTGQALDPKEHERISNELTNRFSGSARTVPSLPPPPFVPPTSQN